MRPDAMRWSSDTRLKPRMTGPSARDGKCLPSYAESLRCVERLELASSWADVETTEKARSKGPRSEHCKACTLTLVPENSSVPLGKLETLDAAGYIERIRGHLNRVIARTPAKPDGFLFACLHGAYDPGTRSYPLHLHGIASDGMIDVVDGLRNLGPYAPAQPFDGRDAANTPILVSRGPLTNMPDPLTYLMQRWWPERETYLDIDGLRKAYGGKRKGIRGPAEVEYLTFLDKWRLEDITLLMGIHVTKAGLVVRCSG